MLLDRVSVDFPAQVNNYIILQVNLFVYKLTVKLPATDQKIISQELWKIINDWCTGTVVDLAGIYI